MNVLIISINRNQQPVLVMPLGACIVAEAAEQAGHSVGVLDLMFEKNPQRAVDEKIDKVAPDVIGLSVRNIDNNDMQNPVAFFKDLSPLVETIRKKSDATIVLGGSAIATMPEEFLRYTETSFAVIGGGEIAFPGLLETFSRGGNPHRVPGIALIENGIFMKNRPSFSEFSDTCFIPDFRRWINVKAYLRNLSTAPIQSKRGCPFECIYCTYALNEGRDYHLYAPNSIVAAIRNLVSAGLRDIEFVDNVFNSPYEHAMAICEELAKAKLDARLQSLELNPLFVDDALLTAMEKAGFVGMGITAENVSDAVLARLRKGFTSQQIHRAAKSIRGHNIPCVWIFMLGGPGETEATVRETLDFAGRHLRSQDIAFFNIGVRIYPGNELEQIARRETALSLSPSEMLEPVFYISPKIRLEWLIETLNKQTAGRLNFLTSNSVRLPFIPTIYRLVSRFGVRPPLWRYTRNIRRGLRLLGLNV